RSRGYRGAVPGVHRHGRDEAAAQVSLCAGTSFRRADAYGAAGALEPTRSGAAVVAGTGHGPRKSDLVFEILAESLAQPALAAAGRRHCLSRAALRSDGGVARRIARIRRDEARGFAAARLVGRGAATSSAA